MSDEWDDDFALESSTILSSSPASPPRLRTTAVTLPVAGAEQSTARDRRPSTSGLSRPRISRPSSKALVVASLVILAGLLLIASSGVLSDDGDAILARPPRLTSAPDSAKLPVHVEKARGKTRGETMRPPHTSRQATRRRPPRRTSRRDTKSKANHQHRAAHRRPLPATQTTPRRRPVTPSPVVAPRGQVKARALPRISPQRRARRGQAPGEFDP
ncbi:MAG: hypothetical protein V7607_5463 [Solirubrobacteraceae bacterium]